MYNNKVIDEIKDGVKNNGINYIKTYKNVQIKQIFSYINEDKYDNFILWLEKYEYNKYYKSCFTGNSITDPIKQFVNAIQNFNKNGC
jgi:hypothetical protein